MRRLILTAGPHVPRWPLVCSRVVPTSSPPQPTKRTTKGLQGKAEIWDEKDQVLRPMQRKAVFDRRHAATPPCAKLALCGRYGDALYVLEANVRSGRKPRVDAIDGCSPTPRRAQG